MTARDRGLAPHQMGSAAIRLRDALSRIALAGAVVLSAAALPAQAIQLRTGEVLVGEVVDATSEGLSFRRLDTGGFLELDWDDLAPLHAKRIKQLEGLLVEADDEPMIEADVVVHVAGGVPQEHVGLIDWSASTEDTLVLRSKGGVKSLPDRRERVKDYRKRSVPVSTVYTSDEWYELERARIDPGEDADRHIALAESMRRAGDLARALEHLEQAEGLGGGKQSAILGTMIQRIRMLKEAAAERELLAEIRVMRNRGQFDRAAELIAKFEETYPDSKLLGELQREKGNFDLALAEHAVEKLRQQWDATLRRVAFAKAGEQDLSLSEARAYAEGEMAGDIFTKIGEKLGIEAEELAQYWSRREEFGRGRATTFSYGIGSWVLDEAQLIDGTRREDERSSEQRVDVANDPEVQRFLRRLKEVRAQQRRAAGAQGGEETEEDWWAAADRETRTSFLRAYFAEFGGQMTRTWAMAAPCAVCQGRGYEVSLGDTGEERRTRCPTCRGKKFTRLIKAR